ncbi:DUF2591 family protein [Alcaligenes sp. AB3]|uniref:phage protein NinX family protein n=1 Tax=Alcaligenes sp. AB3 TaxID=2962569 RepID=UPI002882914D|nr:phage protein NinX family protein [Alcaligenes sp. AB3]MDT0215831.1 DUF2591 family protein [Alcaligenes sp. AB3]
MKKVSELIGAELDYWVAKAAGEMNPQLGIGGVCVVANGHTLHRYCPSTEWSHGGPIIEREKIDIEYRARQKQWFAMIDLKDSLPREWGETCLIAAMRAYVSSKYGDSVPADEQEENQ